MLEFCENDPKLLTALHLQSLSLETSGHVSQQ